MTSYARAERWDDDRFRSEPVRAPVDPGLGEQMDRLAEGTRPAESDYHEDTLIFREHDMALGDRIRLRESVRCLTTLAQRLGGEPEQAAAALLAQLAAKVEGT
jgi:hypothetical protein